MSPRSRLMMISVVALAAISGCASQDPVGIRIDMQKSGSGTIAVASLSLPEITREMAARSDGVAWNMDARLTVSTGAFETLDGIRVEDLQVQAREFGDDGSGALRIRIPCGADASWFRSLHVSPADRGALRKALEQSINEIELHENVTIAVEIEEARVAGSLVNPIPRVTVSSKEGTCTLVVPLEILESRSDPMVLVLNWERPTPNTNR